MVIWFWIFAVFLVSMIGAVPNAVPTERISGSAGDVLEDNPVGRLKVYVYDLPSKYNKKTLQKDSRCLTHMFAAEIYMHRFLLNSPVRTLNPDEADWFYSPIYVTCDLTPNGLPLPFKSPRMMRSAVQLISSNWPYWNRTDGADHFFVVPHDFGACFHYQEEKAIDRGILPLLQRATLVQTFGQRHIVCLNDGSITIPPYCPPQKMKTHLIPPETPRSIFVYFRGLFYDVNNDPEGGYYARGARAAVWENFKNNALSDISTDHPTTYYEDMQRAIFCLCPLGWAPWSPRLVEAVVFGCIPVIIADDIVLPFADAIPWEEIGVFVDEKDVSNLDTILTSILPDVILRKQRLLANLSMKRAMMFPQPAQSGDAFHQILNGLARIGGILTTLASIGCMTWLLTTPPYEEKKRTSILLGSALLQGASIGPLINVAVVIDPSVLVSAFVGTAVAFVCFSGAALVARRREFLYLGGLLSSGVSMLFWLHFASSIFGGSTALFKFELYFGLLIFVGYMIVDTQEIIEKAHFGDMDYVKHALTLFTDFVAVFVRILIILLKNSAEKNERKKKRKD